MSWEQLSLSTPKCRKPTKCVWCWEPISVGDQYVKDAGKFDGEFQSNAWHPECRDAMLEVSKIDRYAVEDGWMPGDFKRGSAEQA